MSDLRTRIAAVVREHQQGQEWGIPTDECECGWSSRKNEIDYADHLADAVILELGLHRNDEEDEFGNYRPTGRYRYVTEWTADD